MCKSVKMSSSSLQCASFLLFSVCTVTAAAAVRYFIVFFVFCIFIDSIFCLCINGCLFSNYAFFLFRYRIYCVVAVLCCFDLELRAFTLINFARDLS